MGGNYAVLGDRMSLVSENTMSLIVKAVGSRASIVARKAGRQRRGFFLSKAPRTIPKIDWLIQCFNKVGWGKIAVSKLRLEVHDSIITDPKFIQAYVEGLLALNLKPMNSPSLHYHIFTIETNSPRGEKLNPFLHIET